MAVIYGTNSADTLTGTGSDTIYGLNGNDTINAGDGDDALIGGRNNDTLTGGAGNDVFVYDARNFDIDTITDLTIGADKIDLTGLNVADIASLANYVSQVGSDTVITTSFAGGTEKITLLGINAATLLSSAANFVFNTNIDPTLIDGTNARDVLFGGNGDDILLGYNGSDDLNGGAGNDTLNGGGDNDLLRGGAGADVFQYDGRNYDSDTIADFVIGTDKLDLRGLGLADTATLANYVSQVGGDAVITTMFGGTTEKITLTGINAATLLSNPANFIFDTSALAQRVDGSNGRDVLFGGSGNDTLTGKNGDDDLNGGAGNDILIGGAGDDLLRGGKGLDTFRYDARVFGSDTIADFLIGPDKLDLRGLGVTDTATLASYVAQVGSDTVITTVFNGTTEKITLTGISAATLLANPLNFVFDSSTQPLRVDGSSGRDVLFGGNGNDTLTGNNGNDDLNGGAGNDTLIGGAGDDLLRGGKGLDTFRYDARIFGSDTIADFLIGPDKLDLRGLGVSDTDTLANYVSQVGSDTVITTAFNGATEKITLTGINAATLLSSPYNFLFDTSAQSLQVDGSNGRDVLFGGSGNDTLNGSYGNDDLNGGAGNDVLIGGAGDDLLRGGKGIDVFRYDSRAFGSDTIADLLLGADRVDLRALGIADTATLANYVSQVGSDTVITTAFNGLVEKITLTGINATTLLSNAANFVFNTNTLGDIIDGTNSRDVLFGGNGNDSLNGSFGNDDLNGGAGDDTLNGGADNDLLRGGAGADVFQYSTRNYDSDTIADFVFGTDKLDLRGLGVADTATLASYVSQVGSDTVITTAFNGSVEKITLIGVDAATLLSNAANFIFNTNTLGDIGDGTTGRDVLFGSSGDDRLSGNNGNDDLNGGAGNDTLVGGGGDDLLRGGAGADVFRYDGRAFGSDTIADFVIGTDKLDLRALGMADTATLANYVSQVGSDTVITTAYGGLTETITLTGINAATLLSSASNFIFNTSTTAQRTDGTSGRDVLFGGSGNDTLYGYSGNDDLNGGAGNDTLVGGTGSDQLRGGTGADRFVFGAAPEYASINDFSKAEGDKIDFRAFDTSDVYGRQPLTETSSFTAAGQFTIVAHDGIWTIHVNLDTNLTNDEITIDVHSATAITAADILL